MAETYLLPENGDSVIGAISLTTTRYEDTISDLAWAYDQGFREMQHANPGVDPWLPGDGTEVIIPSYYVLPDAPKKGIVINVPEMRLYYYPKPKRGERATVVTYPISIGRQDWATPYGSTSIIGKKKDPTWTPPKSIKKEHAEMGDPLPDVVPAGPDNPLGQFAMRLGKRGYLIHGTNKPYGLGMRVTHGCIRLYPKDIEELFGITKVGTRVQIIDQPYKAGWLRGKLYVEAHPALEEAKQNSQKDYQQLVNLISKAINKTQGQDNVSSNDSKIDWNSLRKISQKQTGIPALVGFREMKSFRNSDLEVAEFGPDLDGKLIMKNQESANDENIGDVSNRTETKQSSYSDLF
ncbi:MAG: L,D-transpeptidase family protein [Gammaproteobacteria bacterium]